jgi:hypothetical protein
MEIQSALADAPASRRQFSAQKNRLRPDDLLGKADDLVKSIGKTDRKLKGLNAQLVVMIVQLDDFYADRAEASIEDDLRQAGLKVKALEQGADESIRACVKLIFSNAKPEDNPGPATLTRLAQAASWVIDWRVTQRAAGTEVDYPDMVKAVEDIGYYKAAEQWVEAQKKASAADPDREDQMGAGLDRPGMNQEPAALSGDNRDDEEAGAVVEDTAPREIQITVERPIRKPALIELQPDGRHAVVDRIVIERPKAATMYVVDADGSVVRLRQTPDQITEMLSRYRVEG